MNLFLLNNCLLKKWRIKNTFFIIYLLHTQKYFYLLLAFYDFFFLFHIRIVFTQSSCFSVGNETRLRKIMNFSKLYELKNHTNNGGPEFLFLMTSNLPYWLVSAKYLNLYFLPSFLIAFSKPAHLKLILILKFTKSSCILIDLCYKPVMNTFKIYW